jgi:ribonuclease P protein component
MLLYSMPNDQDHPRLGLTASAKVGPSVTRHRLKRWAREIFRRWERRAAIPSLDLIVHFKPPAAASSFGDFRQELERLLTAQLPRGTA